jgi:hypothetical protein
MWYRSKHVGEVEPGDAALFVIPATIYDSRLENKIMSYISVHQHESFLTWTYPLVSGCPVAQPFRKN